MPDPDSDDRRACSVRRLRIGLHRPEADTAQIDDLKSQVTKLSSDDVSIKSRADATAVVAQSAAAAAQRAQATADSASAAVTKNQQAIEAINDKIDRMFRRSVPK